MIDQGQGPLLRLLRRPVFWTAGLTLGDVLVIAGAVALSVVGVAALVIAAVSQTEP